MSGRSEREVQNAVVVCRRSDYANPGDADTALVACNSRFLVSPFLRVTPCGRPADSSVLIQNRWQVATDKCYRQKGLMSMTRKVSAFSGFYMERQGTVRLAQNWTSHSPAYAWPVEESR